MEEGYPHEVALPINYIRQDGGTQTRSGLDSDTVYAYAQDMAAGDQFPAIECYYDGAAYWLADGFHRLEAARENGEKTIIAKVHQGTQRDAILASASANARHGLRRTNQDKRRAVLRLLMDEEWGQWSDREIARRCHVSHPFVAKVREAEAHLLPGYVSERTYTTRHGTVATMRVNGSGVGEAEPVTGNVSSEVAPSYIPVWELEQHVKAWLGRDCWTPNAIVILERARISGPIRDSLWVALERLGRPWKQGDLLQARNNVLDQHRQRQAQKTQPPAPEKRETEMETAVNSVDDALLSSGLKTQLRIDALAARLGLDRRAVIELAIDQLFERERWENADEPEPAIPTF